jgi:hypothetical protein
MGFWFCRIVLLHEFVHHFRATYRAKRKPGYHIKVEHEEDLADLKAIDLFGEVFPGAARAYGREREEKRKQRRPEFERRLAVIRRRRVLKYISERNPTDRHK